MSWQNGEGLGGMGGVVELGCAACIRGGFGCNGRGAWWNERGRMVLGAMGRV